MQIKRALSERKGLVLLAKVGRTACSIVPGGMYGGHGVIFLEGNPIF